MRAIEIARRLAACGAREDALRAYALTIHESGGQQPAEELEAAIYLLENGGDYKTAYTCFIQLYHQGEFRQEALDIMTRAFYEPNVAALKKRYEKNCRLLQKYPYLFRKDFLPFDQLPLRFYPFDDSGYLPFVPAAERFGPYVNFNRPVVGRNFFADLEKPILAHDVWSQYELEYLNDNVRPSEWVGRENHIYLHYADWGQFCAHLQCWNLRPLLEGRKLVFLIGGEIGQYPLDFKERFGVDYSQYPVKPLGIREINRMVWHTQLAAHNGGDFFNEIFHGHPNLLMLESVMFENMKGAVRSLRTQLEAIRARKADEWRIMVTSEEGEEVNTAHVLDELRRLSNVTDKDLLAAFFLSAPRASAFLDRNSRIAPALFFQPHFSHIDYEIGATEDGRALLLCEQYDAIRSSPLFLGFKYIKTFTPLRRPTTSHGATVKFMAERIGQKNDDGCRLVVADNVSQLILNRSYLIDWQDRLFQDSVLVRFEDGKLNPRATFTALAAFLDLPYTESLTYCSNFKGRDPETMPGNARGFDPTPVYRTYEDYINRDEGCFLEYFLRDIYQEYGYDFHYYDGAPVDDARLCQLIDGFTTINGWIEKSTLAAANAEAEQEDPDLQAIHIDVKSKLDPDRLKFARLLQRGLYFINKNQQPLHMMPLLQLDPALLEQPLYH